MGSRLNVLPLHRPPTKPTTCRTQGVTLTGFAPSKLPLGEIRQFEIVEEQVDKFIAAQNEPERIFTVAFTRLGRSSAAFSSRTRQHVTFDELLVAGKHHVAGAAFAAKARFARPVERDADLAAFQDILDVAVLRRFLDGALNQRLGPTQEALAVLKALAARIQAPIDDVHSHPCICLSRLASPACTIRRGGEPDARYSRVPPCARQTRRASFRYRRPFSSQTR